MPCRIVMSRIMDLPEVGRCSLCCTSSACICSQCCCLLPNACSCSWANAQHGGPSQDANLWDVSSGGPTIVFTQSGARADFQV